jgi:hypothetical protein
MRDTDLVQVALGVKPPWVVRKSEFDATAKRLDIYLDFARGSRFVCPQCVGPVPGRRDREARVGRRRRNRITHLAPLAGSGWRALRVPIEGRRSPPRA